MADFHTPVGRLKTIGPEFNPWYWHPNRAAVRFAPDWFLTQLRAMGEELSVTWNPINERWQVWSKTPRFQHPVCQGWRLLFIHNDAEGQYMPLDERVFARLYSASADKDGSAKAYFDRIVREYERDAEKKEARLRQEAIDQAMPFWDHSQIKVAMRGESNGSKFSTYHA